MLGGAAPSSMASSPSSATSWTLSISGSLLATPSSQSSSAMFWTSLLSQIAGLVLVLSLDFEDVHMQGHIRGSRSRDRFSFQRFLGL